ncbi:MAG: hypothetical protein J6Q06_00640 [Clostridia bacterium]|nr:hypothetical protein [Clostridia bacterium]
MATVRSTSKAYTALNLKTDKCDVPDAQLSRNEANDIRLNQNYSIS